VVGLLGWLDVGGRLRSGDRDSRGERAEGERGSEGARERGSELQCDYH
jgi:hypothetical protein